MCKLDGSMASAHPRCVATCPLAQISRARAAGGSKLSPSRCRQSDARMLLVCSKSSGRAQILAHPPRRCFRPPARDEGSLFARRGRPKGMLQLVPWSLGVAALQARLAPLIWARVSCVDEPPGVTVSLPSRCRVSGEMADTVLADGYAWVQQQRCQWPLV